MAGTGKIVALINALVGAGKNSPKETKAPVVTDDVAKSSVASFSDGADGMALKSCVVSIDPVQDLHGQDAPYPAGATANLIPDGQDTNKGYIAGKYIAKDGVAKNSSGNYISEWFSVLPETQYTYSAKTNQTAAAICFFDSNKDYISGVNFTDDGTTAKLISVTTPSGAAYARATQAYANSDLLQFEAGSTGTTIKPYSNICPITGWTGCNVTRTGRNIADASNSTRQAVYRATTRPIAGNNGFYLSGANGAVDTQMLNVASWANVVNKFSFTPDTDVTVSLSAYVINYTENCNGFVRLGYMDKDGNINTFGITRSFNALGRTDISIENVTIPKGCTLVLRTTPASLASAITLNQYAELRDINISISSTATDYEPYQGSTYPITFSTEAGTVYGGTVDLEAQTLTVDRMAVDLGSLSWEYTSSAFQSTAAVTEIVAPSSQWGQPQAICERYAPSADAELSDYHFAIGPASYSYARKIRIKDPAYSGDADAFKTAVTGTKIVCKLTTPLVYSLTDLPTITTLPGYNAIWSDTGAVAVTYPADTKLYVQKELAVSQSLMELIITANHESGMTASKAYSSGDLLIVNGTLYKATTSIANGGTLTVGTNVTATTVANELAALA